MCMASTGTWGQPAALCCCPSLVLQEHQCIGLVIKENCIAFWTSVFLDFPGVLMVVLLVDGLACVLVRPEIMRLSNSEDVLQNSDCDFAFWAYWHLSTLFDAQEKDSEYKNVSWARGCPEFLTWLAVLSYIRDCMKTKRNAPCPCGSGKKYKKCCLPKTGAPTESLTHVLLHRASDESADLLMGFAVDLYGKPVMDNIMEQFCPEIKDPRTKEEYRTQVLVPWLLYHWYPEELYPAKELPCKHTVVGQFLARHRDEVDSVTQRHMQAAARAPLCYWQVASVEPGSGALLTDLITGKECFVHDMASTQHLKNWDIILAHVVGLDGYYIFNNLGPFTLPPYRFRKPVETLTAAIKKDLKPAPVTETALLNYHAQFVFHYMDCVHHLLNPMYPTLVNTDGEDLVQTTSRYDFDAEKSAEVTAKLGRIRNIGLDDDGRVSLFSWVGKSKTGAGIDGKVRKGMIEVHRKFLETECNSKQRDKRLRKLVEKHLGSVLTYKGTAHKEIDPKEMLQQKQGLGTTSEGKPLDLDKLSPEDREGLVQVLEQQYMKWADENVPDLGNKTPRQVVKTAKGRKQIAAMINEWENMMQRQEDSQFSFDFNKLRQELGLEAE